VEWSDRVATLETLIRAIDQDELLRDGGNESTNPKEIRRISSHFMLDSQSRSGKI
jgi:hypothetical protein